MKIMIATGGTGGHINPALDLAHILKERNPKNFMVCILQQQQGQSFLK